jgi:cell division protein FtsX
LQLGLYVVILVFLISISIITYSIIWNFIYYYRDEIYITRLVWGSKVFIYGPFVLQWGIYSFISFLLSLIVFLFVVQNVNAAFSELYFLHVSYNILFIEMITFILMWWISGFFSSRKYLK